MTEHDYTSAIKECAKQIEIAIKGKMWSDDEKVLKLFELLYDVCYEQIHSILEPQKSEKTEKEIRDIISKYVVGGVKGKKTYIGALKPLYAKMKQISSNKQINQEFISRYLDIYDDFLALASFRSFEHFALYIEKHLTQNDEVKTEKSSGGDNKIIEHTLPLFKGWYFYATKMVLDGDVKFIAKQMPTSYGKSYGDVLLICFILR